jgi:DNA-binding phage protein
VIYLNEYFADGNMDLFQEALQDVAKAQGGMKAEQVDLNRESLDRTVSKIVQ